MADSFYNWPPYDCTVVVDGVKRAAEEPDEQLRMALTLFTMAGRLKEPVTPRLKAYIISKTKEVANGTEAI